MSRTLLKLSLFVCAGISMLGCGPKTGTTVTEAPVQDAAAMEAYEKSMDAPPSTDK